MPLIKQILEVSWHRNGIGGAGFHAILFTADIDPVDAKEAQTWAIKESPGQKGARFLATVFDEPGHVAVICLHRIPDCGVRFGANSWRGDRYEPELRHAIETHQSSGSVRVGPFGIATND